MPKKFVTALLCVILMTTMAGCWDYSDINTLNFPLAASYDLHEGSENKEKAEQQFDLTVVLPNLSEQAKEKYRIEKTTGVTIGDARGKKAYDSVGIYSPGVITYVIIGKDLAEKGLLQVLEGRLRRPESTWTAQYAIAEGRGETVLNVPEKNYENIGYFLKGLLQKSNRRGYIPVTTLYQIIIAQAPGKNPVIPMLRVENKKVKIVGSAIFNKDRMIGRANLNETRSLMMLRGISSTGVIPFSIIKDGEMFDKGTFSAKNSRKVKVETDGDKFVYTIRINLKGELTEHYSKELFIKNKELQKTLEDHIASNIKADCEIFVQKMQEEYKVDCIDISKYALAHGRKALTDRIDEDFIQDVQIKVDVKVKIVNIGELD